MAICLEWRSQSDPNDVCSKPVRLVAGEVELVERMGRGVRKGDATDPEASPFIDGRLGVAYGILDPVLRSFSSTSVAARP